MATVRLGIVGIGSMGSVHAQNIVNGKVPRCELTAVCDPKVERISRFSSARGFLSAEEFLRGSQTDAVLIATPHYSHTSIGIETLGSGRHLLVEKPISVHKADAERLIAAHRRSNQVFAAMFNQRTDPYFLKLRQLVRSGLKRITSRVTGELPGQARGAVCCSTSAHTTWIFSNGFLGCLPASAHFAILAGITISRSKTI
jgi:predicted dehydrogenase